MIWLEMESPVGRLRLVRSSAGLAAVLFHTENAARVPKHWGGIRDANDPLLVQAGAQLHAYFQGTLRAFDVPLAPRGTAFQLACWQGLRRIPYGVTVTYGQQARAMGAPNASRAVGAANGRNPLGIVVPCHRVVGSNGALTGFGGGLQTKRWLLDHEARVSANAHTQLQWAL